MTRVSRNALWILLVALMVGLPFACAGGTGGADAEVDAPAADAASEAAPDAMTTM